MLLLLVFLATVVSSYAQEEPPVDDSSKVIDSTIISEEREPFKYVEPFYVDQPVDSARHGQQPTIALFKSMVIPGWGQIGNGKYIKAGLIIGLEAYFISRIIKYAGDASDARDAFDEINASDAEEYVKTTYLNKYKDARADRNKFSWYLGTTIFISMFDAFVDAHLSNFPKKDQTTSFHLEPADNDQVRFRVAVSF